MWLLLTKHYMHRDTARKREEKEFAREIQTECVRERASACASEREQEQKIGTCLQHTATILQHTAPEPTHRLSSTIHKSDFRVIRVLKPVTHRHTVPHTAT